jgi:hypothetical protein
LVDNGLNIDCTNVYTDAIPRGCDRSVLDVGSENLSGSTAISGGNGGAVEVALETVLPGLQ